MVAENLYIILSTIAESFIEADLLQNKEIKFENINVYIERAIKASNIVCDEETIVRLFTDIECRYKITHEKGSVIYDDYDDVRNWYSNNNIKDSFFWNRYKKLLINNPSFNSKSINLLEEDTLPNIMNCLGDPNNNFEGKVFRRGLVIGDVQSGKTATYAGLICKAADAGYKVVILLAGITESLRQQTQERIDESVIGISKKKVGRQIITETVGVGKDNKGIKATSFTSCVSDFVGGHDTIATSLDAHKSLVVFVVKKNVSVLERLYKWLRDHNLDPIRNCVNVPMLLIDDEADNASVNTKGDDTDPTKTNKCIREICDLFSNTTYVGFTATPFANVFINPESVDKMQMADLFPEHFIYVLEAPSNYVGAQKIFYKEGVYYKNIRYITDIEEPDYSSDEYREKVRDDIDSLNSGPFYYKHKKEWNGLLPSSLDDAVLCFYLGNIIRDLRGQQASPRSMLVNMSRFINVQRIITDYIERFHESVFDTIRFDFNDDSTKNTSLELYARLRILWEKHFSHVKDISFDRVIQKNILMNAIEKIKIVMVNGSKQSSSLDYRNNKSLRVIAIGGLALSRGLTLEGLLVSYFYRNTATFDVLMQMGRWFGYRTGYEDIFQIWTSKMSAEWYAEIARSSQELKDSVKDMYDQRLTPKNFGIKVRDNCAELQITASNKMRSAKGLNLTFSFYGNIYDTPYVSFNIEHNRNNTEVTQKLIQDLFAAKYEFRYADMVNKVNKDVWDITDDSSRYFADVPKNIIVSFVESLKCSMANGNFNIPNIVNFLNDTENINLENWDVVIAGGDSEDNVKIKGLEQIKCSKRSIYYCTRNVVQISSRRRALSGNTSGKAGLTKEQIKEVERKYKEKEAGSYIPVKAYFEYLPDRKPVLVIIPIVPDPANSEEHKALTKFREELGMDNLLAFAIGLPGVTAPEKAEHYKVNKVFQKLYIEDIEDNEEEEVDDEN